MKRYKSSNFSNNILVEDNNGEWVRYDDYKKLKSDYDYLFDRIKRLSSKIIEVVELRK